jgi:phosphate transporter
VASFTYYVIATRSFHQLKDRYLHEVVEKALPFTVSSKDILNDASTRLLNLYAKCVTRGDVSAARQQLKLHQRENIAWERDTVWRQMIGSERRGESDGQPKAIGASLVNGEEGGLFELPTPAGRFKLTKRKICIGIAVLVFLTLLNVQTVQGAEANRCFAILVFCTILWATEVMRIFPWSSNFAEPFFRGYPFIRDLHVCSTAAHMASCYTFRRRKHTVVHAGCYEVRARRNTNITLTDFCRYVFSIIFSPTIMLLIGGFTISSALSKTNIDRILITKVLSLAGSRPSTVLLAFMAVSCFASMWIR